MDDRTRKALLDSIAFWRKCAAGDAMSRGVKTCALCRKFYDNACKGCPVREHTGKRCCDDTPYDDYVHTQYYVTTDPMSQPLRKAAKKELNFLLSLLPEGTRD